MTNRHYTIVVELCAFHLRASTFALATVDKSRYGGQVCGPLRIASAPVDVRTGSLRTGWRSDGCDPFYGREYATLPPTIV